MNVSEGKVDTGIIVGALIAVAVAVAIGSLVLVDTTGEKGSGLSDAYDLDATKLAKFDPNLVLYEEKGTPIPTGFLVRGRWPSMVTAGSMSPVTRRSAC